MVFVAAFVFEQNGGAMVLSNDEVGSAVVVIVSGNDRARIFELNLVEADVGGDILPSVRPQVAEELYFALAIFRLARRDEVHPTVVIVIEGSHTVGTG